MKVIRQLRGQEGLSLLETLIAAFILLFVMLSMITSFALGRRDVDQEEIKRKATAIAMDRLEHVRSRYAVGLHSPGNAWNQIAPPYIDTTYVVDGYTFTLVSIVADSTEVGRKSITVDVSWTAKRHNNSAVTRKVRATTDIAVALPLPEQEE
jgi:Tfp pilus assembly protein PilV